MRSNPVSKGIRAVWNMKKSLPLTIHLMKDARVARINKLAFLFVTIGYLVFPYDFIFDLPIFGQFDDLAVLLFMLNWFITRTPKDILYEYGWKDEADEKDKSKKQKKQKKTKVAELKTTKANMTTESEHGKKKRRALRLKRAEQ